MRSNPVEKKIAQAEESVRICKFNIENQEIRLQRLDVKISVVQNKIASIGEAACVELEKLTAIETQLTIYVNLHKGIIIELHGELILNENNLQELKSSLINKEAL